MFWEGGEEKIWLKENHWKKVDNRKQGFFRLDVNILGGFMSVWLMVFNMVYCFGPFFPADVQFRSFLAVLKHIKPSRLRLRALHEINMDPWQPWSTPGPMSCAPVRGVLWCQHSEFLAVDIWWKYCRKRSTLLSFGASWVNGSFPPKRLTLQHPNCWNQIRKLQATLEVNFSGRSASLVNEIQYIPEN